MKKTGGIVAIVAGATGLIIAVVSTFLSLLLAPIFTSNIGTIETAGLLGAGAVLLCIAIVVQGLSAIRTNGITRRKARQIGITLILCAVAASALLFTMVFVILMAQVVVGASILLLDKESPDDAQPLAP